MIRAVGLDVVEVDRIRGVLARHPTRFLARHFTVDEVAYCESLVDPAPSLAARFAAKEAFQKCWPERHGWRDVWVERTAGGAPRLAWSAEIETVMQREGWVAHVSLTHTRDHAAAVVVMETRAG